MKKYLSLAFLVAGVSLLAACGDDDSSSAEESKTSSGTVSVETFDDLAHCTKSHYGEIVFVEEEGTYFECTSEDWVEVDSAKVDSLLAASSSSEGTSEEAKSSSSVKADSAEVAKVETKKVDSVAVSGFAQKGPFASGTAVTVFGLDSALEMTKTKFTGKVSGDSGAFKVEKIVLPSQFALVQASGFYANEVTGKNTSGTKTTLNAIVDLSAGKSVKANVNLFTELEYARVKHLVTAENFNVPAAKKRATKELLAVFGAKAGDDLTATSLSLADTGAAGKALLAASILLQGDLSVSKFGLRLGEVGDLFASTGSLNSDTLRAELADWASKIDSVDNFKSIRTNVKNMKLVATVPDFESVIYAFWTGVYKLGACTDSLEETIKKNENKLSDNYGVGYACTSKRWHKSTALDTDLGLCTAKKEGSFEERKQEKKDTEYYVCKSGTWNKITATQFELKECTEKRENEYVTAKSGEYFVCSGKQWKTIDSVTYELKLCTESRNNKVEITKKGEYYKCVSGEWENSDKLSYELQGAGTCSDKNNLDTYKTESLGTYVCDNKEWRKANDDELELGFCTESKQDTVAKLKSGEYRACRSKVWVESDSISYKLQKICDKDDTFEKHVAGNDISYYVCRDKKWSITDKTSYELSAVCDSDANGTRKKKGADYYACQHGTDGWEWVSCDAVEYELGLCTDDRNNSFEKTESNQYYFCEDHSWIEATAKDYELKSVCNSDHINNRTQVSGQYYDCNDTGWAKIDVVRDSRDGRVYRILKIGNQTWMADDLNFDYRVYDKKTGDTVSYGYQETPVGGRYLWSAAMDSAAVFGTQGQGCGYGGKYQVTCLLSSRVRGICPEGWHLPDTTEQYTLYKTVGSDVRNLQAKGYVFWPEATDAYGFSARPDCLLRDGQYYCNVDSIGSSSSASVSYWSSVPTNPGAYVTAIIDVYRIGVYPDYFYTSALNPTRYFAVRCVKD